MKTKVVKVQDLRKMINEVIQERFYFEFGSEDLESGEEFDFEKAYNEAPQEVKDLINSYEESGNTYEDSGDYADLEDLKMNLNALGYDMDYDLGGEVIYLGPKNSMLEEGKVYDDGKNIPEGIKSWVKSNFGTSVSKYTIRQGELEVQINMPWHDADHETYQFFKLENGNAVPVGNEITRSGMESDSPQGYREGQKNDGKVTVPEGFVLVCYGTYPKRVDIYTGQNVQGFLPDKEKVEDLGPTELLILYVAKKLKSFARPKFKDEYYDILIGKGLMKSNRSITIDGSNLLEDPDIKEKIEQAKELFRKKTGRYI